MNPPINRENLRDVLIAVVVAAGLALGCRCLRGLRGQYSAAAPTSSSQARPMGGAMKGCTPNQNAAADTA